MNRLGAVDDGTTVTDYDEEEIARKHTLSSSTAFAEWNKTKVNLIDTPGMANFFSDACCALRVADAAAVVVDAVAGSEVLTEKVWAVAEELNLPCLVVLNRLDRERASLSRSLESLHEALGRTVVPIQLPIGEEKDFRGVVDLVAMKALTFDADGRTVAAGDVPPELADEADTAREALIELVAEADDTLMEQFFEAGTLTQEQLEAGLKKAAAERQVFPLVCTSATANIGVQPLLDAVLAYLPSPSQRPLSVVDAEGGPTTADASDGASALVWKTVADPFAGRITMFRVAGGSIAADSTVQNVSRGVGERMGAIALMQGKTQTTVSEIRAGDLGAVAKLKETRTGDTLAPKDTAWRFPPFQFTEPVLSYAIEPKSRGDEEKISTALQRLQEEDPTIRYARDAQTSQLLLSGQGQLHIEVTVAKLKRRFGVEVNLKLPRIPYRETIKASTEAHGRHKKQTGGHGQFGDCKIKVAPLPRGEDFQLRRRDLRGRHPARVHPRRRKGHPGGADARLSRGLSDGGLPGHPVRRVVPPRRLERDVVQDGGTAGVSRRDVAREAHAARAGHERRGVRAQRLRRRPHGGPERPPREDRGHGDARVLDLDQGRGPDGGDADLRAAV